MNKSPLDNLLERLHQLQSELEQEMEILLEAKRAQFRYQLHSGRVYFEKGMAALQRQQKVGVLRYISKARFLQLITSPAIYMLAIPFLLLDLVVNAYQLICFPVYGIPLVRRLSYFSVDHKHLDYLNVIEKFNCVYCSYANGVIEFVREVSAKTEQYWCPIKHAQRTPDPHRLVDNFVDFGDMEAYKKELNNIRKKLAEFEDK